MEGTARQPEMLQASCQAMFRDWSLPCYASGGILTNRQDTARRSPKESNRPVKYWIYGEKRCRVIIVRFLFLKRRVEYRWGRFALSSPLALRRIGYVAILPKFVDKCNGGCPRL